MRIRTQPDISKAVACLKELTEAEWPIQHLAVDATEMPDDLRDDFYEEVQRLSEEGLYEDAAQLEEGNIHLVTLDDPLVQKVLQNPRCITHIHIKIEKGTLRGHLHLSFDEAAIYPEDYGTDIEPCIAIHKTLKTRGIMRELDLEKAVERDLEEAKKRQEKAKKEIEECQQKVAELERLLEGIRSQKQ